MRLTVLMDNNTYIDRYYLGEPAVAYYIEDGEKKILFDTAYSGAFLNNADAMGIDLKNITERIDEENLKEIHKWLKENIHRHGAVYTPKELIMNISNEGINSTYYIISFRLHS